TVLSGMQPYRDPGHRPTSKPRFFSALEISAASFFGFVSSPASVYADLPMTSAARFSASAAAENDVITRNAAATRTTFASLTRSARTIASALLPAIPHSVIDIFRESSCSLLHASFQFIVEPCELCSLAKG